MFYQIAMAQSFRSELLSLPTEIARRVNRTIDVLAGDPFHAHGAAQLVFSTDDLPIYRVQIETYRLFYSIGKDWVKLLAIRMHAAAPARPAAAEQRLQYDGALTAAPLEPFPDDAADRTLLEPPALAQALLRTSSPAPRPLPQPISVELLTRLQIAAHYHAVLLRARSDEDLLLADLPPTVFDRLFDVLYPKSLQQINQQPELIVSAVSDLDRLIDGEFIPFLLRLDPEQHDLVNRPLDGPALVRGGPGSGKSIVALYRVRQLVQAGRTPILLTTFTTTLVSYSTQLLERLLGCPPEQAGVTINTVDAVMNERYRSVYGIPRIAGEHALRDALQRARHDPQLPQPADTLQRLVQRLGDEYLIDEFNDVIDGWGLRTLDEYLQHERHGRSVPLREAERRTIWALYDAWWTELHRIGLETWAGIRRRALDLMRSAPDAPYSSVVIDEAQDLSPTALRFLFYAVRQKQGVYLTADSGQSIYGSGFSWRQIDQDLRLSGRSRLLKRNYRNSAQIGRACSALLSGNRAADQESLRQEYVYDGPTPYVAYVDHDDDEIAQMRSFLLASARAQHIPLRAAAILCHSAAHGTQLMQRLRAVGIPAAYVERRDLNLEQPVVKILTLHASKGLEFPLVVVSRVGEGRLPFRFGALPPEELTARLEQQRRLLYVGCSRAMRALLVCVHAAAPSVLADRLLPPHWQPFRLAQ